MSLTLNNSLLRFFFAAQGWRVPGPGETFGVGLRGAKLTGAASMGGAS